MPGRAQDLGTKPVVLYAGTLGLKHDPSVLLALARRLGQEAEVVVVSEGQGADWLRATTPASCRSPTCASLPFQPIEAFPDVLGAADVLVALLEPGAGAFLGAVQGPQLPLRRPAGAGGRARRQPRRSHRRAHRQRRRGRADRRGGVRAGGRRTARRSGRASA